MNILITGANGYIGQRLIPVLLNKGHHLFCCVRNRQRLASIYSNENITILEVDLLKEGGDPFPANIQVAYYLVHSMSTSGDFETKEAATATRFLQLVETTHCQQIIYLSGIVNEQELSRHLSSRLHVEEILRAGTVPVTVLRAGIIVGSGSASFEIIRDLVEKLPIMIAPKWLHTKCQPIGIHNVIELLEGILLKEDVYHQDFDIGGPDIVSYKEMLLQFAAVRKLKRYIFIVPVMTPRISSFWLYFVTSTSYPLAVNLVNSMKVNVICRPNNLAEQLGIHLQTYTEAVQLAFEKIEQNMVLSSWKDAFVSSNTNLAVMNRIKVPTFGCFKDVKQRTIQGNIESVLANIWSIGGERGWYYGNALWKLRGLMDRFVGGVGLRRGRTHKNTIDAGDALDFWRVLVADKQNMRLLLFAEMKLPGEAWLEFKIVPLKDGNYSLKQKATFRPRGLLGRLYWYSVLPFHYFIFNGMINGLLKTHH